MVEEYLIHGGGIPDTQWGTQIHEPIHGVRCLSMEALFVISIRSATNLASVPCLVLVPQTLSAHCERCTIPQIHSNINFMIHLKCDFIYFEALTSESEG